MTCRLLSALLVIVCVLNIKQSSSLPTKVGGETSTDSQLKTDYGDMLVGEGDKNVSESYDSYAEYDDSIDGEDYVRVVDSEESINQFHGRWDSNEENNQQYLNVTDEFQNSTRQVPEYMLELYDTFSKSGLQRPKSDIIRSFMNTNEETTVNRTQKGYPETRIHRLVFNITTITVKEVIKLAELRLYTLVEKDRYMYIGIDRRVSVFEIIYGDGVHTDVYRLISSRHIYERDNGWETFEVTSAVKRWIQNFSLVQILEIRIESVFQSVTRGDIDIKTKPRDRNEPLLIVYSNDSKKHLHRQELSELISHEMSTAYDRMASKMGNRTLHRDRRSRRRRNSCRRTPLYVDFRDINWSRWIISPRGYEICFVNSCFGETLFKQYDEAEEIYQQPSNISAKKFWFIQAYECTGKCYFPLSRHLTPSKHAIIQTLLFSSYPRKASRTCCVPTVLAPISLLYLQRNVITYKHEYDEMVVARCGCR